MSRKLINIDFDAATFLSNIKKRFNLSDGELIELFKKEKDEAARDSGGIFLPVSIFCKNLGMLESAALYLKDEAGFSFGQIAKLLKRDYKTIWASYNKAKKKGGI